MARKVKWTAAAWNDLEEAAGYGAGDSPKAKTLKEAVGWLQNAQIRFEQDHPAAARDERSAQTG